MAKKAARKRSAPKAKAKARTKGKVKARTKAKAKARRPKVKVKAKATIRAKAARRPARPAVKTAPRTPVVEDRSPTVPIVVEPSVVDWGAPAPDPAAQPQDPASEASDLVEAELSRD